MNKIILDKIPSTNIYCKDNINDLENFDLVIAKEQTAGYGRFNREWIQNKNESIAMSLVCKDIDSIDEIGKISIVTAVSIVNILEQYNNNICIKWPNDILISDKKICGILIENIIYKNDLNLIIGIGININNKIFKEELSSKATSLYLSNNVTYDLNIIIDKLYLELVNNLSKIKDNFNLIYNKYLNYSVIIGKEIKYNGDVFVVDSITEYGLIKAKSYNNDIKYISSLDISFDKTGLFYN